MPGMTVPTPEPIPDRPLNWRPVANVTFFVTVACLAVASKAFTIFSLTFAATCLILMEYEDWQKRRRRMTYHQKHTVRRPR